MHPVFAHADGKALITVDDLAGQHPAQQAMVACHGSQCGFCTPGYIGLWVNKQFRALGEIVYLGEVAGLKQISAAGGWLQIGAGASLAAASCAGRTLARHARDGLALCVAADPRGRHDGRAR